MISKKRYWGLALPIYVCEDCDEFEVIGSREELRERAVEGWEEFDGHTPHRPWVDAVKVRCAKCGGLASRIPDVGNPWLDAGIVPFSTLHYRGNRDYWREWFPADFITESFPGPVPQLVLLDAGDGRRARRFGALKTVLGFATLLDQNGEEMHKSKGNSIPFDEAAHIVGADTMRWLYVTHAPEQNLRFPRIPSEEEAEAARAKGEPPRLSDLWMQARSALDKLWNVYSFFVTYANIDQFDPTTRALAVGRAERPGSLGALRTAGDGPARDGAAGRLRRRIGLAGSGRVHRESLELVCAPEPPPLLEERGGRRQARRLSDALRVPGDGDEAAGAADALPGGVALPESGALGGCVRAGKRASLRLAGRGCVAALATPARRDGAGDADGEPGARRAREGADSRAPAARHALRARRQRAGGARRCNGWRVRCWRS